MEQTIYYALAMNWLFMLPIYRDITKQPFDPNKPTQRAPYWFERKPLTCIYCMTFYVAAIGSLFIPLITGASPSLFPVLGAPVLASIIEKYYNSLPTSI